MNAAENEIAGAATDPVADAVKDATKEGTVTQNATFWEWGERELYALNGARPTTNVPNTNNFYYIGETASPITTDKELNIVSTVQLNVTLV